MENGQAFFSIYTAQAKQKPFRDTKTRINNKEEKMPISRRQDLPCSYCDRLCHSAIGKVNHVRACLARLVEENSTNP
jgi:hypothetical protein